MSRRKWLCAMAALATSGGPGSARAQSWPSRPVRIMVGANAGGGTDIVARMLAEQFAVAALSGTQLVHVPYEGSSQAHVDVIPGQVQLMFGTMSSSTPQVRAGRPRPLAVMAGARSPELPEVPTIAEAGFPGAEMTTWYGLYATAGTPPEVIERLHAQTRRIIDTPAVDAKLKARFGKLIREAKIKIE